MAAQCAENASILRLQKKSANCAPSSGYRSLKKLTPTSGSGVQQLVVPLRCSLVFPPATPGCLRVSTQRPPPTSSPVERELSVEHMPPSPHVRATARSAHVSAIHRRRAAAAKAGAGADSGGPPPPGVRPTRNTRPGTVSDRERRGRGGHARPAKRPTTTCQHTQWRSCNG